MIDLNFNTSTFLQNRKNQVFEIRSLNERFILLACTLWLLDNWPIRMVELCKKYNLTASKITRSEVLPFWFSKEIDLNLRGIDVIARNFN